MYIRSAIVILADGLTGLVMLCLLRVSIPVLPLMNPFSCGHCYCMQSDTGLLTEQQKLRSRHLREHCMCPVSNTATHGVNRPKDKVLLVYLLQLQLTYIQVQVCQSRSYSTDNIVKYIAKHLRSQGQLSFNPYNSTHSAHIPPPKTVLCYSNILRIK